MQSVVNRNRNPRPLQEALDELKREMAVRNRCFDRWVQDGKITESDAIDRLDRLWTALGHLESLAASEQQQRELTQIADELQQDPMHRPLAKS